MQQEGQESSPKDLLAALDDARRRFLALVDEIRPELHRYCARMMGSTIDGEDVVQETLAQAYFHLPQLQEMPPLRPWLLRIAHNKAIDALRRGAYRRTEPLEAAMDITDDEVREPEETLARRQAVEAAFTSYLQLPPAQRACVILKDVLEHSLEEISQELDMTVPAVKAALHRGREGLRQAEQGAAAALAPAVSEALRRYASMFNAHDWDGVRALLADEVRLELVDRRKLAGVQVATYFGNYERIGSWRLEPGWLDGREVLGVLVDGAAQPRYFIELQWQDGRVSVIKDSRYVGYIANEARYRRASDARGVGR